MQLGGRDAHPGGHRRHLADGIIRGLRAAQPAAGAPGEIAAALQQLAEAFPGDADVHVGDALAARHLDTADLLAPRHQALAEGEADGVVLEVGRGREHHDVRHVVVDQRNRHLLGDAIARLRASAPSFQRSTSTRVLTANESFAAASATDSELMGRCSPVAHGARQAGAGSRLRLCAAARQGTLGPRARRFQASL